MNRTKGFTLLEVLVVVVIAVSVVFFAVPAYKRMQDRTAYMAAQGVLISIGNAVRSMQADLALCVSPLTFPTGSLQVMRTWQDESNTNYNRAAERDLCSGSHGGTTQTLFPYALFAQKFLEPIPDFDNSRYKNYEFYICPQNQASSSNCCGNNRQVVACMKDISPCLRSTAGLYYGARFYQNGTVERVEQSCGSNPPGGSSGTEIGRD